MADKLIYILPFITLLIFFICLYKKGNSIQTCLWFILSFLPFMNLKVTPEKWGAITVFDFICIYCLIVLFNSFSKINLSSKNNFYWGLFFVFMSIIFLGGLAAEFSDRMLINTLKVLPVFIFCRCLIIECANDELFFSKAIKCLKASYLFALAFLFIQMVVGLKFTFYPKLGPNTIDPIVHIIRYPGVFYDSQASGQYLTIGSFLFLFIEIGASKRERYLSYAVFAISIVAITFAGSRSAFGGLLVGLVVLFFMAGKQFRIYTSVLAGLGAVAISVASPYVGIFSRSKTLSEDYLFRFSLWEQAFDIAKKFPILGIGSGNYQPYVMKHVQSQYLEISPGEFLWFDQPENGYLKILVEFGFIGFGIFLLFILIPLIKGIINYLKGYVDNGIGYLMAGLCCWIVAFNTVYSFDDNRILIIVASLICLIISYPKIKYFTYDVAV